MNILPAPKSVNAASRHTYDCALTCRDVFAAAAEVFAAYFEQIFDCQLSDGQGGIVLKKDESLTGDAYRIQAGDSLYVFAGHLGGANRALCTLLQAAEVKDGKLTVPFCSAEDRPDDGYRGLMLDLARQWHPIEQLYRHVDMCYFYKINMLHLHFTDDQSFTLPCKAYPGLSTPGRHYTACELRELTQYALDRGITVIPEVDLPGHCISFTSAYPEVFGSSRVICTEEKAFEALDEILGEVCDLFPSSPYIHIGGDEAQIEDWLKCEGCLEYMREHGITCAQELYAHSVARLTEMILKRGRTPIVWEGFRKDYNYMFSRDVIMVAWESLYQTAPEFLDDGFNIINASWKPLYVIPGGKHWPAEEILAWDHCLWQNWWDESRAYPDGIRVADTPLILGSQMCVWCDQHPTGDGDICRQELELLATRLPALAERSWNAQSSPMDIQTFCTALENTAQRLKKLNK